MIQNEVTFGLQVRCLPIVQMKLQAGNKRYSLMTNTAPWRCFPQAETLEMEAWLRKRNHQPYDSNEVQLGCSICGCKMADIYHYAACMGPYGLLWSP